MRGERTVPCPRHVVNILAPPNIAHGPIFLPRSQRHSNTHRRTRRPCKLPKPGVRALAPHKSSSCASSSLSHTRNISTTPQAGLLSPLPEKAYIFSPGPSPTNTTPTHSQHVCPTRRGPHRACEPATGPAIARQCPANGCRDAAERGMGGPAARGAPDGPLGAD